MINLTTIGIFLISLSLGVIYIKSITPAKKKIFVFPTPDNISQLQFTDLAKNCFQYETTEVTCPTDPKKISNYVVQEGLRNKN